jgi:hypothetical protein
MREFREKNPGYFDKYSYKNLTDERKQIIKNKIKEYKLANKMKEIAHNAVEIAVKYGRLEKLPCVVCGDAKSEGHHEDYGKPLDVIWLCKKHHLIRHRK